MERTTYTVKEIVELKRNNMLYPNPEYQRGAVWKSPQKKRLIDSVFRGYPLPLIYLHHKQAQVAGLQRDNLEIIDGQQRINALYEFKEGAFKLFHPIDDDKEARFPTFLKKTPCPWATSNFDSLSPELQQQFLDTPLFIVKISDAADNEARDLFIRLQAGLPLNAQEKRDAWPGGFTEFILKLAGKPEIARYPGHDFFSTLIGGQSGEARGKTRQLCAQMAMLYLERRRNHRLIDIKTQSIDDYYYKELDFDALHPDAQRFVEILDKLVRFLGDGMRPKLKAHYAIHLTLLLDSLIGVYTLNWENRFTQAFDKFANSVNRDKLTRHNPSPGEFWTNYDVHTRTSSAEAATIEQRHIFFQSKMLEFLSPLTPLHPDRGFGPIEREIIYFRDGKQCMYGDGFISWGDLEIHHVNPHALGGATSMENGKAVHRECHRRGGAARA